MLQTVLEDSPGARVWTDMRKSMPGDYVLQDGCPGSSVVDNVKVTSASAQVSTGGSLRPICLFMLHWPCPSPGCLATILVIVSQSRGTKVIVNPVAKQKGPGDWMPS